MRHSWRKIVLAALLSLGSFALTHFVYVMTAPKHVGYGDREPIAFVSSVQDEVQRRPVTRMIWQLLERGEPVFPGEAVRTSSAGEVSLEFVGSKRRLDLEPDTLIVLSKSQDEISMELLDGGAFVAGDAAATDDKAPKLTLQSSGGKVDLSKATASVSKGQGKAVDLKVIDGQATLSKNGQKEDYKSDGDLSDLKILSPTVNETLYQSMTLPQPVTFKWEGVPAGARVELFLGSQRKSMRNLGTTKTDFKHNLKPGRYFWKLVVTDATGKNLGESPVFKLEVQGLAAPAMISPIANEALIVRDTKTPVDFIWSNPPEIMGLSLEIAKDSMFKQILVTERVAASEAHFEKVLEPGSYFWRVTAYYPDGKPTSPSAIRPFEVVYKAPKPVRLAWDSSLSRKQYFVNDMKLSFKWSTDEPDEVHKYYVRVARSPAALNEGQLTESQDLQAIMKVNEPGHYFAAIEAVNKKGDVISRSDPKEFDLSPMPLLSAPQFDPHLGDLRANVKGDLQLKWKPIEGAQSYFVTLKDSAGTPLQEKSFTQTSMSLNALMPGTYQVEIYALDAHGRKSNQEAPRKIIVPESSGLSAPKLKKVKVN